MLTAPVLAKVAIASWLSLVQAARCRSVASGFVRGSAVGAVNGGLDLLGSSCYA